MLNVNGQKMSKSFGNYFLPKEIIEGTTELFNRPYSANVIRLLMMQAHYRSTMDFTEDALNASEKGLERLLEAAKTLQQISAPILIAKLFDTVKYINSIKDGKETIGSEDLELLKTEFNSFAFDVLGLMQEGGEGDNRLSPVMELVLDLRQEARANKDWPTSDKIRDGLAAAGINVKDSKDETSWS